MKKRSLNKIKQMVSIGMSCIMAGSTCNLPMMLHAEEVQTENMKPTYMVTSFDELNEEIAYQALSIGAEESEINFPDTLKVKVIRQVEEEASTEADESVGEGNGAEDSQEGEEWTIEHITWKLDAEKSSLPEFDSSEESAGAVYKKSGGKAHGFNRGMKAKKLLQLSDNDVEFCRNVVQATARFVLVSLCVV